MRRRRLALASLALVLLAACSDDKPEPPTPTSLEQGPTTSTLPPTPVVARIVLPEAGSVSGIGGRGLVVVLTLTAADPTALPAQFRLGTAASAKPGRNPAIPGLVVGTTSTPASLGGPTANLANLFQIVSPALQPDGSIQVTAVWTNAQVSLGTDIETTIAAVTVADAAPDVIPEPLTVLSLNSNLASVSVRLSSADTPAVGVTTTSTTTARATTTVRSTTTTRRGATTTTAVGATTTTTRASTTTTPTTVAPTTSTTRLLGVLPP